MKKQPVELRLDQPGLCERTLGDGEAALLNIRARWPRLEENAPGLKRVNRYYDALAERWIKRWEGPLLELAKKAAALESPGQGERTGPLPWSASLDFTVTLFQDGLFSLYLDVAEDVGQRRRRRVRQGDVWRLPAGLPVTLRELLPRQRWWRGPVLEEVRRQAGERIQAGEAAFYDDWLRLVSKRFSPSRFYLTGDGAVVFYPVESIAPAMEGFPSFSLAALVPQPAEKAECPTF